MGGERPLSTTEFHFEVPELLPHQNMCIQDALNATDYYLLQGPPGTGKTSVFLINYIGEILRQTKRKVVVLAFTNKAVDKICENLRGPRNGLPVDYIRLGSKHVVDPNLFEIRLEDDNPDGWRSLLTNTRLLVSTINTFQNRLLVLKEFFNFTDVIIDEASQLTEADLVGILCVFEKFVLIGDQKQLPAVIVQSDEETKVRNEDLARLGIVDFRMSLFERLWRNAFNEVWTNVYGQLTNHYRMHDQIAQLIKQHYRLGLTPSLAQQVDKSVPYLIEQDHPLHELSKCRTIFIETPPTSGLKKNANEASLVGIIASELVSQGVVAANEIGIITPFRAQVGEIKKFLQHDLRNNSDLIVDTVERFQGDERRIIIYSSTVNSTALLNRISSISAYDEIGTDRKLLVCISRASEQLIVLGNSAILSASRDYRDMIEYIRGNGGYIDRAATEYILNAYAFKKA